MDLVLPSGNDPLWAKSAELVVDVFFAASMLLKESVVDQSLSHAKENDDNVSDSGVLLSFASSSSIEYYSYCYNNGIDVNYHNDQVGAKRRVIGARLGRNLPRVRSASASSPMANIDWPPGQSCDTDVGRMKIKEFIEKVWSYPNDLHYTIEPLFTASLKLVKRFKYRVCWIWASHSSENSIDRHHQPTVHTACVYFNLDAPLEQPDAAVQVSYTFQSDKRLHRPGRSNYHEKWLGDLIEGRIASQTA